MAVLPPAFTVTFPSQRVCSSLYSTTCESSWPSVSRTGKMRSGFDPCVWACVWCKDEVTEASAKLLPPRLPSSAPTTGLPGPTSCASQSSSLPGLPLTNCIDLQNRQLCNCLSTFNLSKLSQLHMRHTIWNSSGCFINTVTLMPSSTLLKLWQK